MSLRDSSGTTTPPPPDAFGNQRIGFPIIGYALGWYLAWAAFGLWAFL